MSSCAARQVTCGIGASGVVSSTTASPLSPWTQPAARVQHAPHAPVLGRVAQRRERRLVQRRRGAGGERGVHRGVAVLEHADETLGPGQVADQGVDAGALERLGSAALRVSPKGVEAATREPRGDGTAQVSTRSGDEDLALHCVRSRSLSRGTPPTAAARPLFMMDDSPPRSPVFLRRRPLDAAVAVGDRGCPDRGRRVPAVIRGRYLSKP